MRSGGEVRIENVIPVGSLDARAAVREHNFDLVRTVATHADSDLAVFLRNLTQPVQAVLQQVDHHLLDFRLIYRHLCIGFGQAYLCSDGGNLRFQDCEGISNHLFQAHLRRPPAFAATKRLDFTKDGSEYSCLRVDGAKALTQARKQVVVARPGALNIALSQMGFIANFGKRCPAVVQHRVNELPERSQTSVARQDLLDHFDAHLKFSFSLLYQIEEPGVVRVLLPDQGTDVRQVEVG